MGRMKLKRIPKLKQIIDTLERVYNVLNKSERQMDLDVFTISNNKIILHFKDELGVIEAVIEDGDSNEAD